ncbi:hypothetical protein AGDE_00631 [Angomonas deanei]|uniref:Uncharacterized protein n=1 Tax=Angomonas deanei TaxID=59799 RepID=A0A7G2CH35_9TRYP|nr:hypothetical protein AGDE_00631 [Angomonas deanei]CAD2218655.1 hypothetical protein, conserved [Angomonas deanei]|eukprot:EPY43291.1 hypothetical protein AGDE_00631 [Angomonas deanei]
MADAARTVKHYVSDCLDERHPYDVQKGFGGQRERDAGKVFDGLDGADALLDSLVDTSLSHEEKAKAAHYLYSRSASQEEKITLLEKSCVSKVVGCLRMSKFPLLEQQCFQILRSLCILPQGCYYVVNCGGVEAMVNSLVNQSMTEERVDARVAAAQALFQLCANTTGLRWVLKAEECEDFIPETFADTRCAPVEPGVVVHSIGTVLDGETPGTKLSQLLLGTLSQILLLAPGIFAVLHYKELFMKVLVNCLQFISDVGVLRQQKEYAKHLFTALWNLEMDQSGVEAVEEVDIPSKLFVIFSLFCDAPDVVDFEIQRVVMGAISASYKLTSVKQASLTVSSNNKTRIVRLLDYLRKINDVEKAQKQESGKAKNNTVAILKNSVQCVRLSF